MASILDLRSESVKRFRESDGRTAIWLFRLSNHSGVAAASNEDNALDSDSGDKPDPENWFVLDKSSGWGDRNEGGGGNLKKVGDAGSEGPKGE